MKRPQSSSLRRGRVSLNEHYYSITFATHNREPLFVDIYLARLLVQEMMCLEKENVASTICFVIMPDHVHWLMQVLQTDVANIVKKVKGRSARAINIKQKRVGNVWQDGFHDHGVRSEESLLELSRYIVSNPLRANLVSTLAEYSLWDAVWLRNRD